MNSPIATFSRFIYLNAYALLLLIGGAGFAIIPFFHNAVWVIIIKVVVCAICLKGAVSILSGWNDKKRKYEVLITRNKDNFRPDTFKEFMEAPCGRLLTRIVLKDLGLSDQYKTLWNLYHIPYWKHLKNECKPKKTVVYRNPDFNKQDIQQEA